MRYYLKNDHDLLIESIACGKAERKLAGGTFIREACQGNPLAQSYEP